MSIKIQITEDNVELSKLLASYLTTDHNIEIVNISHDGNTAIKAYKKFSPDILLLDLSLPEKNGIEVLDTLCNLSCTEKNKCNVIVLSGDLSKFIFNYTSKLYRVFSKPYELDKIMYSIYELYQNINKPNYRKVCQDTALKLGFNISSIGTKLLIDTILFIIDNDLDIYNLDYVYNQIAISHNMSMQKVKWNIEKTINSMFRYSSKSSIYSIFKDYDGRKPTPKYSIGLAINELRKL